jgi:hypothetical protein
VDKLFTLGYRENLDSLPTIANISPNISIDRLLPSPLMLGKSYRTYSIVLVLDLPTSPANAAHLHRSISQFKQGQVTADRLIQINYT